ncbi:MAG: single-stranded-DNA-specific exonuclease RecJ [Bacteroidia bacterium]|nr:single-stranded-DNA-specific exonuclease RecJ [Bacteroidia bacterium]
MRWIISDSDRRVEAGQLSHQLGQGEPFPLPLAELLLQRGVHDFESARAFFKPDRSGLGDPWKMKDVDKAVARLLKASRNREKILVFGDYDVDGTTSVTLFSLFFKDWGIDHDIYIPDRYKEGYGMSFQGIDYAAKIGASLLLALDCGTKAIDKVKYAHTKGVEVIICDHHTPGPVLPDAVALINPKRVDCPYPFKEFSAAGVGFKLLEGFLGELKKEPAFSEMNPGYDLFDRYCDLVTLSIASDIVPVVGENRIFAHFGIEKIQKNPLPGIQALKETSQVERTWDISDLVFFLGPRINSAGRLGDAKRAVKLLQGVEGEMEGFALELNGSNEERKELDSLITDQALYMIESDPKENQRSSTVLYQDDWHKGVIGIVASRLIETHYKPTILLTKSNGNWVGSGRSVHDFDLYAALEDCADHILQFGGHKYAAGLTIKDDQIVSFKEKFEEVVSRDIREDQKEAILEISAKLDFSYILPKFVRLIKRFGPFGPGNMEPVFMAEKVRVTDYRILKEKHLRLNLLQNGISFEAIGFGLAAKWLSQSPDEIDIAFQPDFKTWNDKTYIQLKLKDFRPSV